MYEHFLCSGNSSKRANKQSPRYVRIKNPSSAQRLFNVRSSYEASKLLSRERETQKGRKKKNCPAGLTKFRPDPTPLQGYCFYSAIHFSLFARFLFSSFYSPGSSHFALLCPQSSRKRRERDISFFHASSPALPRTQRFFVDRACCCCLNMKKNFNFEK